MNFSGLLLSTALENPSAFHLAQDCRFSCQTEDCPDFTKKQMSPPPLDSSETPKKRKLLDVIENPANFLPVGSFNRPLWRSPVLILVTPFANQYWKNDHNNLQCFPYCPVYGDYYTLKLSGQQHIKAGFGCASPVIARLHGYEKIPESELKAFGRIILKPFAASKESGRVFTEAEIQEFSSDATIGVFEEGNTKISFPNAKWKLKRPLSKRGRRPSSLVKSDIWFVFEVLVFNVVEDEYTLVAATISTEFEISSTRTLQRKLSASKKRVPFHGTESPISSCDESHGFK